MPNLLPKQSKKNIQQEYRFRILTIGLLFALLSLLVGFAFLIPSYVLLKAEYSDRLKKRGDIANIVKVAQGDDYIAALGDTTAKILTLKRGRDDIPLLETITKTTDQMIPGVSITSFDYTSSPSDSSQLTLIGEASTRDTLITFKNNIQSESLFTEVTHSIADLIKAENLDFTFNIKGNF